MSTPNHVILIKYDTKSHDFCAIWETGSAIGMGMTEKEALYDLREAVHLYIDTAVSL